MENDNYHTTNKNTLEQDTALLEVIKKEGFISYEIQKRCKQSDGGNYLGDLTEIVVRGKKSDGDSELNLFMKSALPGDKISVLSMHDIYQREIFTYTELEKLFVELQSEVNVPKEQRYKIVKAYGLSGVKGSESIILEDMSKKGYKTQDRMKCMSNDLAERAVATLAKFHSLSYVIKELRNDAFQNIVRNVLSKTAIIFGGAWKLHIKNMEETVMNCVTTPEMQGRINKVVEKLLEVFPDYHLPNKRSVICHGDYRTNNLLIKEENGTIIDVIPIDYQLMYHGCPLNDFFHFIFVSTSREYRKNNFIRLKELYRNHLKEFLRYFSLDLENIYPSDEFQQDFKNKLEYGLMVSIQYLPIILAPEDDTPKYGDKEISEVKVKSSSVFEERMGGIIDDFIDFNII